MPQAAAREVLEETGLIVSVGAELGSLDDAADVLWVTREEAGGLPLTDRLLEILDGYGTFGGAPPPDRRR